MRFPKKYFNLQPLNPGHCCLNHGTWVSQLASYTARVLQLHLFPSYLHAWECRESLLLSDFCISSTMVPVSMVQQHLL